MVPRWGEFTDDGAADPAPDPDSASRNAVTTPGLLAAPGALGQRAGPSCPRCVRQTAERKFLGLCSQSPRP